MFETIKALFGGIFQALTGGLGLGTAIVAIAQLVLQIYLGNSYATGGFIGTTVLIAVLFVAQAAGALLSFMTVGGDSFSPKSKQLTAGQMYAGAVIWSVIVVFVIGGGAAVLFGATSGLTLVEIVIAAVQSAAVVGYTRRLMTA